ncbi:hypothetical protein ACIO1C_29740 [Streptomyces sp. NPDC087420]|uniref:hypothetical protein n=1 Tax=Streptomyces sp. NPDC087420 TaxID=3365785 RepID=UPI0038350A97
MKRKSIDMSTATPEQLAEARYWVKDAFANGDDDWTDEDIVQGTNNHYEGGWAQFIADVA